MIKSLFPSDKVLKNWDQFDKYDSIKTSMLEASPDKNNERIQNFVKRRFAKMKFKKEFESWLDANVSISKIDE